MKDNIETNISNSVPNIDLVPPIPVVNNIESPNIEANQDTKIKPVIVIIFISLFLLITGLGTVYLYFNLNKTVPVVNTVDTSATQVTSTLSTEINLVNSDIFINSEPSLITTIAETGELKTAETISIKHDIDENTDVMFYLTGKTESIDFHLISPNGTIINESFAKDNQPQVEFEESSGSAATPSYKIYSVKNTEAGEWLINLRAINEAPYKFFAIMTQGMTLESAVDKTTYKKGENMIIAARLKESKNPSNIKLYANIHRSDKITDKIELQINKNGIYVGMYTIPNISGYITTTIEARGIQNGYPFTRDGILLTRVNDESVILTNVYSEKAVDKDQNGLYDQIDFTFEVNATKDIECSIQAELYSGSDTITQKGDFVKLSQGEQFITLSFDGKSINREMKNGPYTIKGIFITPLDTGITTDSREGSVLTTNSYKYSQFETAY